MITGNPILSATLSPSSTSSTGPGEPGTVGTLQLVRELAGRRLVAHLPDLLRPWDR